MSKKPTPGDGPAKSAEVISFPKAAKSDQRRADERWGKGVMGRGYTIVPALLIRAQHRLGLSPEHFNTLLQLIYHWWEAGNNPHPAKALIASRMDKSEKQVQRYLKALENAGFIRRIERYHTNKGQTSNEYDLSGLAAKLALIAAEEEKVTTENKQRQTNVERRTNRRGQS
jgi:predicted transcriptional regulator